MITYIKDWYHDKIQPTYEQILKTDPNLPHLKPAKVIPCMPHVDERFFDQTQTRVMHVGLNSYLSQKELPPEFVWYEYHEHEEWWEEHINEKIWHDHHYMNDVQQKLTDILGKCVEYRTNLIKIYMGSAIGTKDHDAATRVKEFSRQLMFDELDMLKEQNAFPHIIITYRKLSWQVLSTYFHLKFDPNVTEIKSDKLLRADLMGHTHDLVFLERKKSLFGYSQKTDVDDFLHDYANEILKVK